MGQIFKTNYSDPLSNAGFRRMDCGMLDKPALRKHLVEKKIGLRERESSWIPLTYSTKQSPSWEDNRFSDSQEIPRIL